MAAKGQTLKEFGELSQAEKSLLDKYIEGGEAIISPIRPIVWSDDKVIRSEFLKYIILRFSHEFGLDKNFVKLRGGIIFGALDLKHARIVGSLFIQDCCVVKNKKMELSNIFMYGAHVEGSLILSGTQIDALYANRIYLSRDLEISNGFCSQSALHLIGAKIDGILNMSFGKFLSISGLSVNMSDSKVDGKVVMGSIGNMFSNGAILMNRMSISGEFIINGGDFLGNGHFCLSMEKLNVKGDIGIYEEASFVNGTVNLLEAVIGGSVIFSGVSFSRIIVPLSMKRSKIEYEFKMRNVLNLDNSYFDSLFCSILNDSKGVWGNGNIIHGFRYDFISMESDLSLEDRIKWLKAQKGTASSHSPQPWTHLKKTLKNMGRESDARKIGIEFEYMRRNSGAVARYSLWHRVDKNIAATFKIIIHIVYGWTTGFGYAPLRLIPFIILFWIFFGCIYNISAQYGHMGPNNPLIFQNEKYISYGWREQLCIPDIRDYLKSEPPERSINWYYLKDLPAEYTGFSPFGFSLDLLLPVVDLMQDKDWGPLIPTPEKSLWQELTNFSPPHWIRIAMWVETLIGWFFSLLIVAVISGMARNTRDDE